MASLFEAYITNLGKYNEGELVGETLKFPTTTEEVQGLLKRIGVDGVRYEEFFITSFDGDVLELYDYLGEYENLDELNHLACLLSELDQGELWEIATSPEALLKLCTDLLAEREKNAALREDNARLQSKAVYYDLFIDLHHSTNLRTTAKELDVPERRFVRFLLERRFVYRTPSGCVLPYAKSANDGLFCVRDYYRNGHTGSYTLVTPKGKLHFAGLRDLILVTV